MTLPQSHYHSSVHSVTLTCCRDFIARAHYTGTLHVQTTRVHCTCTLHGYTARAYYTGTLHVQTTQVHCKCALLGYTARYTLHVLYIRDQLNDNLIKDCKVLGDEILYLRYSTTPELRIFISRFKLIAENEAKLKICAGAHRSP